MRMEEASKVRIGLVTTIDTNIGDALIRDGICSVLKRCLPGRDLDFVLVNKHDPLSVYPRLHPAQGARLTRHLPRGKARAYNAIEAVASRLGMSRFDGCDMIVQCGTPVLWPGCHGCEWAAPIWHHVIGRLSKRVPVLNIAAGSCYPWENKPSFIADPDDARYLRMISSYCRVTTVRDRLAQVLLESLNVYPDFIPCAALLANEGALPGGVEGDGRAGGPVLINYMHGAGHYDCGQEIDAEVWRDTVLDLIGRLKGRHRLAFLCHNRTEFELAKALDHELPRLWPRNTSEYFQVVSQAAAAVCNRMHASVALAGIGVPSVAICTDTRLLMVEAIGLPCFYVKDTSPGMLEHAVEDLLAHRRHEAERLSALRAGVRAAYSGVIAGSLESESHWSPETCSIDA
jgi:hypothetical protein